MPWYHDGMNLQCCQQAADAICPLRTSRAVCRSSKVCMLFDFFASDEVSRLHALLTLFLSCAPFVDSRALRIASAAKGYSGVHDLKYKPCLSLRTVDVLLSDFTTGYKCSLQS
jgi:hypothetical protein